MKKDEALVNLSRLALTGRRQDIQLFIRRLTRQKDFSDIKDTLNELLRELPSASSPSRSTAFGAMPVDMESRLQLLRFEQHPALDYEPVWTDELNKALGQIIQERQKAKELSKIGLGPTKTALFVGPPGVGKTMGARWIARELGMPLAILDLSAVMSSFLGRTGTNLRMVLDYAKSIKCVLLLDEMDAIAKRRDDTGEIGELKRLVTVLLQEIDDWPSDSLMLAATNHPALLDPAVWRRFEVTLNFNLPNEESIRKATRSYLGVEAENDPLVGLLAFVFKGMSFSDVEKECLRLRRDQALKNKPLNEVIEGYISSHTLDLKNTEKRKIIAQLINKGYSDRKINSFLRISRDTSRKVRKESGNGKP